MIEIVETQSPVDIQQLTIELQELGVAGLAGVAYRGTDVVAMYDVDPDAADTAAIRAAINSHVPSDALHVRLHDFLTEGEHDLFEPPLEVDYITGITGRLHSTNSIVVQGEVRQRSYYADVVLDQTTNKVTGYENLVVQEDFSYTRDPVGFAVNRTQTISWARKDGTLHPTTKQRVKHYEDFESLIEGQRRRRLLVDLMAMTLSGWLVATQTQHAEVQDRLQMGREFLRDHKDSFDLFVDVSDAAIVYEVRGDADPDNAWLDSTWDGTMTVRDWVESQVNIWNLP
jgi:hypothetical protein